ncbi:transcriptional regulator [Alteribacillus sp. HJP-4]|uniref:helix-turn-helix transcriptional regulator n=1 Tax=Alteribacillus sp. HJP-4 TaxID=2775394 RepID=UPI0035CD2E82
MENVKDQFEMFSSIIKGIAAQFGDKCEVVLHDLTEGYESTIVAIENAHITGRKVGDPGSNLGLEVLRGKTNAGDRYNYITQTKDGKVLRSSSMYLKNDEQEVIGCICINFDISDFIVAENVMKGLTMNGMNQEVPEVKEAFVSDVNELLDFLLNECQNEIGKPVSHMSKHERMQAIKFLDQKGAFLVKKAGDRVCKFFDISKFTLYNYLDEIRETTKS